MLIERARNRLLDGYVERHHIIPRCMGGSDERENLVQLTPEEHYVAHQLLVKLHPTVIGLTFAAIAMSGDARSRKNKAYGWIRRTHAKNVSEWTSNKWRNDPAYREAVMAGMERLRQDPEYVEMIRKAVSAAHKGRVKSPEEIAKFVASKTGMKYKPISEESRARYAEAQTKKWEEHRANGTEKLAAAKTRAKRIANGSYAKTPEQRAAISAAQKGRAISPDQRAKISASMKAYRASIKGAPSLQ